jgi:hypothetical protein
VVFLREGEPLGYLPVPTRARPRPAWLVATGGRTSDQARSGRRRLGEPHADGGSVANRARVGRAPMMHRAGLVTIVAVLSVMGAGCAAARP